VRQLPNEGVHTKNSKAIITYMLPLDNLLEIVIEWTRFVRSELGENALWYPNLSTDGTDWSKKEFVGSKESRRHSFTRALRRFCKRERIPYRSPHKLRHGHGVFIAKNSATFEEFKAFSQNMGHSTTDITDRFYSKFSKDDVRVIVMRVGAEKNSLADMDKRILDEFEEFKAFKRWQEKQLK